MDKLLTIVIPAYNISQYISKIISSILKCYYINLIEILIVNDGSNDDTLFKARYYEKNYPDIIKVINKENGGHGSTINEGIKKATGKYFKVIDGDDWINHQQMDMLLSKLSSIEDDIVVCGYTIVDNYDRILQTYNVHIKNFRFNKTYTIDEICAANTTPFSFHSLYYKVEMYKRSRKIDEHCFYVDLEYALYPFEIATTIRLMHENIYMYRIGNEGQSVSPENYYKNKKDLEKVLLSLSSFASDLYRNKFRKEYVLQRTDGLYTTILDLYFNMQNCKEANIYIKKIDRKIKDKYPLAYYHSNSNHELRFLRMTKYKSRKILILKRKLQSKKDFSF